MDFLSVDPSDSRASEPVIVTIRDSVSGREVRLKLPPWLSISDVKQRLQRHFSVSVAHQRLFAGGCELKNWYTLNDCNIQDYDVIDFCVRSVTGSAVSAIQLFGSVPCSTSLRRTIQEAQEGLSLGLAPKLTLDGTSGTYMLRNGEKRIVGVFKPRDEEPFAPLNPRGHVGRMGSTGFRDGVKSGEAAPREVAAYLLDHQHFSQVPPTTMVEARHSAFCNGDSQRLRWKEGSFQEFVEHEDTAEDFSSSMFTASEIHKIAILDIRLVNTDRNDSSMLVIKRRSSSSTRLQLIPIDHGLTLPDTLEITMDDVAWMTWPQVKEPFSEAELAFIEALDPDNEAQTLLKVLGIREECVRNMRITGRLLKLGAKAGLTLYDIGCMMYREDWDTPTELERIVELAERGCRMYLDPHTKPRLASMDDVSALAPLPSLIGPELTAFDWEQKAPIKWGRSSTMDVSKTQQEGSKEETRTSPKGQMARMFSADDLGTAKPTYGRRRSSVWMERDTSRRRSVLEPQFDKLFFHYVTDQLGDATRRRREKKKQQVPVV